MMVSFQEDLDLSRAYGKLSLRSPLSGNSVIGGLLVSKSTITEADCKVSYRSLRPNCTC